MTTTFPTPHYGWLTMLSKAKRRPLLMRMTQTELRSYAAYLFHTSGHDALFACWLNSVGNRKLTPDDVDQ